MVRQDLWLVHLLEAGRQVDGLETFPEFQPQGAHLGVPAILHQLLSRSKYKAPIGTLSLTTRGRIMSFSSWPRMWQCHTYSCPKLAMMLTVGVSSSGCPVFGLMLVKPSKEPSGIAGFRGRMLLGTGKGSLGKSAF